MSPGIHEFGEVYGVMSEQELMELARGYDSLVEDAQAALRAEFARRGLEPPLVEDAAEPAMRDLVTLAQYRDLSEAIVAKGMLEAAGVEAWLEDENLVRLDWMLSNMIGGIRLQVAPEDVAAATKLLGEQMTEPIPFAQGEAAEQPACPRCGSKRIVFEGASRGWAAAALWAFSVPLPTGRKTWRCDSCGARWENTGADGPEV